MDTTFAVQRPHRNQTPSEAPNDYSPQQAAPPPLPGNPFPSPLLQRARIHHTPQLSPATSSFASTSSEYDPLELAPTPVSIHQPRFISPHPRTPASGKLAERLEHATLTDDQLIEQHHNQQLSRSAMSLPLTSSSSFYHHGVGSAAGGIPGSLVAKSPSRQEYMPAKPRMAPLPYEWSSPPDGPPSPSSSDVAPFQTDEDLGVFSSPTGFALNSNGSPMQSPEASRFVDGWFSADDGGAGNIFAPSAASQSGAHGVTSPGKLFDSWGEDYVSSPVAPVGNTLGSSSLARSASAISHYPWSSSHPHASAGAGSNYSYGHPLPMSRSVSAYPAHGYSGASQPMLASMSVPNHGASMAVNPAHIAPSSSQDAIAAHAFGGHVSVFSSDADADDDIYSSPQPAPATIGRSNGHGLNIVIPGDREIRAQAGVFQQDTLRASAALANVTASSANAGASMSTGGAVEATVRGPPLMYAPPIRMPNGHTRPPLALTREMWEQHNQQQAAHAQSSSGPSSFHSSSWASSASSNHPYHGSSRTGAQPSTSLSSAVEPQGMFSMMTMPRGNKGNFKFKGKVPNWEEMPTKRSRGRRPHQGSLQQRPAKLTKTGKPSTIYVCEVPACGGQIFQRSEHLKRHIASIHMDIKPFQCAYPGCDKRFSRKDNLRQHSKIHSSKGSLPLSRPSKMSRTSSSVSEASFSSSASSLGLSALNLARGGSASVNGSGHGSASEVSHSGASDDEDMGSGDEMEDEDAGEGEGEGEGEDEGMDDTDLLEDEDAPGEH